MRAVVIIALIACACSTDHGRSGESADGGACFGSLMQASTPGGGCGYFGAASTKSAGLCSADLPYPCAETVLTLTSCDSAAAPLMLDLVGWVGTGQMQSFDIDGGPFGHAGAVAGGASASAGTVTVENADEWGMQGSFDVIVRDAALRGRFDTRHCASSLVCPRLAQACALAASGLCPPLAAVPDAGTPTGAGVPCPAGYADDGDGGCTGGDPANLRFDIRTVPYSAEVTLDCLAPARECFAATNNDGNGIPGTKVVFGGNTGISALPVSCDGERWTVNGPVLAGSTPLGATAHGYSPPAWYGTSAARIDAPVQNAVLDLRSVKAPAIPPRVHVSGEVTLNNAPFPPCGDGPHPAGGTINFYGPDLRAGGGAEQPCTGRPGWTFSFDASPGTWDVHVDPGPDLNGVAQVVRSGLVVGGDMTGLRFDLVEYPVEGTLTLNGAAPDCRNDRFVVSDAATFDAIDMAAGFVGPSPGATCNAAGMSFKIHRPRGTYQIGLAVDGRGELFAPPLQIDGPSELAVDIATTNVSGAVTLGGAPIVGASCQNIYVAFLGRQFGARADVRCDGSGWTFSGAVEPGNYDVELKGDGRLMPAFSPVLGHVSVGSTAISGVQVDANPLPISGAVTLNAGPLPQGCAYAMIEFSGGGPGLYGALSVPVDCTGGAASFHALLYPGTYQVTVYPQGMLPGVGKMTTLRVVVASALDVAAPTDSLAFDVRAVVVGGRITANGGPFPYPCSGVVQVGEQFLYVSCDGSGEISFLGAVPPGRAQAIFHLVERPGSPFVGDFVLSPFIDLR
jgi:hypothetical protein